MVITFLLLLLPAAAAQSLPGRGMRCGCNYTCTQPGATCVPVCWQQISATGRGSVYLCSQ